MKALAVAAGIVFWTLVLGVAVLVFFPGGNEGQPVAVLQVDPAPAPPPAASAPQAGAGNFDLPPGFAVTGPASVPSAPRQPAAPQLAPPGQGTTMVPVGPPAMGVPGPGGSLPQPTDRFGEASSPAAPKTAEADAAGTKSDLPQVAAADLTAGIDNTGSIPLPTVPAPALVEESKYGPLPKIAADGRRPAEVYARPSRYAQTAGGPPRVAVLVNGLGVPGAPDGDVIKGLPPPVSIAYGAYGRSLQEWVTRARAEGHEVLLAIPLEPNDYPTEDPGPHTLLTTLPTEENIKRLHWLMSRYAGYVGVTNHMGAKFETTQASFQPVLEELKRRGLIYLDDGSVQGSAAGQIAAGLGLTYSIAQVRLDSGTSTAELAKALAELEAAAKASGTAIGVAKASPGTVKQIADWAGSLEAKGLVLVPVSTAMRSQRQS
jgi:uncharacterized protein